MFTGPHDSLGEDVASHAPYFRQPNILPCAQVERKSIDETVYTKGAVDTPPAGTRRQLLPAVAYRAHLDATGPKNLKLGTTVD